MTRAPFIFFKGAYRGTETLKEVKMGLLWVLGDAVWKEPKIW